MQGNSETLSTRRAIALRRLQILRMRRTTEHRTTGRQRSVRIPIPPTPPACLVNSMAVTFLFEKRLKYSDVKNEGRIVIPKSFAEIHMPRLEKKEGLYIFMDDLLEVKIWRFRYRFWSNNTSRVYVLENTSEFTKAKQLKEGDFMRFYYNNATERFAVGVRRAGEPDDQGASTSTLPPNYMSGADVGNIPTAINSNTMASPTTLLHHSSYYPEMQSGLSSSTSVVAENLQSQNVAKVRMSSIYTSSYADGLQGFPMHLLNMGNISDLPEY